MSQRYIGGVVTETTNVAQNPWTGEWTQQAALQGFAGAQAPTRIANSLRLRSSASAYLNRTPSVAGNRQTFTFSFWAKRGTLGTRQLVIIGNQSSNANYIEFSAGDVLGFSGNDGTSSPWQLYTTQVFRDPSAWYHIIWVFDSTQATSTNRVKMYVNGVQVTAFGTATYPTQNYQTFFNQAVAHQISGYPSANYFDGYLAEVNFVDGQALPPTAFGQFNKTSGIWQAMPYTGTYGLNGFKLNFSNGTSTTTLGYDSSGNGNNWTTNNISLTAGSTYDWMLDSPVNSPGSSYGVGNYAVLNPLMRSPLDQYTPTNGNLSVNLVTNGQAISSIPVSSGKWYFESVVASGTIGTDTRVGFQPPTTYSSYFCGNSSSQGYAYGADGNKGYNGSFVSYGNTWGVGDVVGTALDLDNGKVYWSKNGVWQASGDPVAGTNAAYTGISGTFCFVLVNGNSATNNKVFNVNFGQRPFAYTPPSGYKSLCTQNLPVATIYNGANFMAATLYTGTGGTAAISNAVNGVSFQPDFVWCKRRSGAAQSHNLADSVRGATKMLYSDLTYAETTDVNAVTAFNSNGFSTGSSGGTNNNGDTYVAWNWKAGGTAVTNTAGSISSQVSANTTSGFAVVTYTGTGSNATVGHGLGVAPSMMIFKVRSTTNSWLVYHASVGATAYLLLDSTAASTTSALAFNNTAPTSSVFTISTGNAVNQSTQTYVAYCFAAISGYSAFGSYTGNGSTNGPFVYCGFRPRWILIKCSSSAATNWVVWDTARDTYNVMANDLLANSSAAESQYGITLDALSNGFKIRNDTAAGGGNSNTSSATYIYAAFAENPFQIALAR